MSKFSLDVLQQRVFPFFRAEDPDILLGAAFGEDVALTRVGGDILASHVDPIVGAFDPLRMISSGTLAVTLPPERLETTRAALTALGVPFAHVGQVVPGEGVHVRRAGQVARYTEIRCEADELARMWALYPRA